MPLCHAAKKQLHMQKGSPGNASCHAANKQLGMIRPKKKQTPLHKCCAVWSDDTQVVMTRQLCMVRSQPSSAGVKRKANGTAGVPFINGAFIRVSGWEGNEMWFSMPHAFGPGSVFNFPANMAEPKISKRKVVAAKFEFSSPPSDKQGMRDIHLSTLLTSDMCRAFQGLQCLGLPPVGSTWRRGFLKSTPSKKSKLRVLGNPKSLRDVISVAVLLDIETVKGPKPLNKRLQHPIVPLEPIYEDEAEDTVEAELTVSEPVIQQEPSSSMLAMQLTPISRPASHMAFFEIETPGFQSRAAQQPLFAKAIKALRCVGKKVKSLTTAAANNAQALISTMGVTPHRLQQRPIVLMSSYRC